MKLYRCVIEIKMKTEFDEGCGPSKSAVSRGEGSSYFTPLAYIHFKLLITATQFQ